MDDGVSASFIEAVDRQVASKACPPGFSGSGAGRETSLGLPWDLREWVPAVELITWVEEEAWRLTHSGGALPGSTNPETVPDRVLLGLLTYGYATGSFTSQAIARQCSFDVTFRLLCNSCQPFGHELQQFRRRNQSLIAQALKTILARAVEFQVSAPHSPLLVNPHLEKQLHRAVHERVGLGRHLDALDDC